jgi:hypothetical protein
VDAPRQHCFDTRWACVRADRSAAAPALEEFDWDAQVAPRLRLVPTNVEPESEETEEAGTQRLLAAMAAAHTAEAQTRRSPWL